MSISFCYRQVQNLGFGSNHKLVCVCEHARVCRKPSWESGVWVEVGEKGGQTSMSGDLSVCNMG